MTKRTALIILLLTTILTGLSSYTKAASPDKVHLFEKYDFGSGQYAVVGMPWGGPRHKIMKEVGNYFYTDEIEILEEMKEKWITDEAGPMFACGYHYIISVLKNGEIEESFSLNLEEGCNTIITEYGPYFFDTSKLTDFKEKFKKPVIEKRTFETFKEGRAYIRSLSGRDELLMVLTPRWLDYDGEFKFYVDCDFGDYDRVLMQQCLDNVEKQIAHKYAGEKFSLEEAGSITGQGKSKLMIRMKGSKALYDEFDLYKADGKWRDYSPVLTVLWKETWQGNSDFSGE